MNVTTTITVEIGKQKHEMSVADARQPTLPTTPGVTWPIYPPAQPYHLDSPPRLPFEVWCGTSINSGSKTVFDQ